MDYYNSIKQEFLDNKVYHEVKDYSKNKKDLETYYNVGKLLIDAQGGEERAKYGNKLIKEYSMKLTLELGKGYSVTTLKYAREFYLIFQKGQPLVDQLSWSHYTLLIPIKDKNKRNYYINECIKNNLSKRELETKIKSKEYERLEYKDKTNIEINDINNSIEDTIKNPILIPNVFDNNISEKRLKYLILENLDMFLKELGTGYMYVGNEYKIKIEDRYYYIDILLYNIEYNCYVVLELKTREFQSKDIGQVKLYMNYIDEHLKKLNQNNTIGIIICKEKNKYVLKYISDPNVFVTKYQLFNKELV